MALDPITDLYYLFRYILFHSMISRSKKLFTIDIEKVAPIKLHSNNNKFICQLLINFSYNAILVHSCFSTLLIKLIDKKRIISRLKRRKELERLNGINDRNPAPVRISRLISILERINRAMCGGRGACNESCTKTKRSSGCRGLENPVNKSATGRPVHFVWPFRTRILFANQLRIPAQDWTLLSSPSLLPPRFIHSIDVPLAAKLSSNIDRNCLPCWCTGWPI